MGSRPADRAPATDHCDDRTPAESVRFGIPL